MYEFDLYRIMLGDKPPWFLLEVTFRTVVIFGYTLVLLRWMGKRGMGNLTPFEFAIIVALGSAVGDPMFYDDVPLVHTMLVIAIIVGMQRLLAYFTEKNEWLEQVVESTPRLLVADGVIDIANLHSEQLSRDELFEALRQQGIRHLGQVEVAFLEPSGKLSVIRPTHDRDGLSILPEENVVGDEVSNDFGGAVCCAHCGTLFDHGAADGPCVRCQSSKKAALFVVDEK